MITHEVIRTAFKETQTPSRVTEAPPAVRYLRKPRYGLYGQEYREDEKHLVSDDEMVIFMLYLDTMFNCWAMSLVIALAFGLYPCLTVPSSENETIYSFDRSSMIEAL